MYVATQVENRSSFFLNWTTHLEKESGFQKDNPKIMMIHVKQKKILIANMGDPN